MVLYNYHVRISMAGLRDATKNAGSPWNFAGYIPMLMGEILSFARLNLQNHPIFLWIDRAQKIPKAVSLA